MSRRDLTLGSEVAQNPAVAGNRLVLFNDAATGPQGGGAFDEVVKLIQNASKFVFISDWSFQPLVRLGPNLDPIGSILLKKVQSDRDFLCAIHTWNHTAVAGTGAPDTENDKGEEVLEDLAVRQWPPNLMWRSSSRGGLFWSFHQKYVIADTRAKDGRRSLAVFAGGLDLTRGRFDWPEHRNLPDDPQLKWMLEEKRYRSYSRKAPDSQSWVHDEWYSNEFGVEHGAFDLPREAWHDIYLRVDGPAAWSYLRDFAARWFRDKGETDLDFITTAPGVDWRERLSRTFLSLYRKAAVVQDWEPPKEPGPWKCQVVRSGEQYDWKNYKSSAPGKGDKMEDKLAWTVGASTESSIQAAYLKTIESASRFIYIETQYFIGAGDLWGRPKVKNKVPTALVDKILEKAKSKSPFHVYIVMPLFPEGNPSDSSNRGQRFLESKTIAYMLGALNAELGRSAWTKYLSFYFLAHWVDQEPALAGDRRARVRASRRYPIYVHSKMMLVDDEALIIGSANLNERSLNGGRDGEICVAAWAATDAMLPACRDQVMSFRGRLWAEHLGLPGQKPEEALRGLAQRGIAWQKPEQYNECAFPVQLQAAQNYLNFRAGKNRATSGHLCRFPVDVDTRNVLVPARTLETRGKSQAAKEDAWLETLIPDAPVTQGSLQQLRNSPWSLYPEIESWILNNAELVE